MKKIIPLLLLFLGAQLSLPAQKEFSGSISYNIEYIDVPEEFKPFVSMLPKSTRMYLSDSKIATVNEIAAGKMMTITDVKTDSSTLLLDMMGMKYRVDMATPAEKADANYRYEYVKEKKEVAGYKCTKANMVDQDGKVVSTAYVTSKIPATLHTVFTKLEGFPLQYEVEQNGIKVRMTATEVDKKMDPSSKFKIGDGYKVMSAEEFKKMFGGMKM